MRTARYENAEEFAELLKTIEQAADHDARRGLPNRFFKREWREDAAIVCYCGIEYADHEVPCA